MTSKGHLLLLCSPAMGSGKSTAAEYLVNRHNWSRVVFAEPIKGMTWTLLACAGVDAPYDYVHGNKKEELIPALGTTSRRIQQLLGTEFGRNYLGENVWTDLAMRRADHLRSLGHNVVIDDMRFYNEFAAGLAAGGVPVRIRRKGVRVTTPTHASEGALDGIQMSEIDNSGTVEQLHRSMDVLVASLFS